MSSTSLRAPIRAPGRSRYTVEQLLHGGGIDVLRAALCCAVQLGVEQPRGNESQVSGLSRLRQKGVQAGDSSSSTSSFMAAEVSR